MYQLIIVAGYLGGDPELKTWKNPATDEEVPVCNVSVATTKKTGRGDARKEVTTWFRVTLWRDVASNAVKYLNKGDPVLFDGEIKPDQESGGPRVYERRDGSSGASYEVTARTFRYLPNGRSGNAVPSEGPPSDNTGSIPTDEIPF